MAGRLTRLRDETAIRTVVGAVVSSAFLLGIVYLVTGFPVTTDYSILFGKGVFPDVLHERATAWEALWGDPYRPLSEILTERGYEDASGGLSPRLPAALMLQLPLILIPQEALMPSITVGVVLILLWIGWLVYGISRIELWKLLWAGPVILISLPVVASVAYSPIFGLLSVALILASWRYQDRRWVGVLLGVAACLRVWPGLVIVGFWLAGKRRLAYEATGTFVLLNAAAVLLPGVSIAGTVTSLLASEGAWLNHNQNASLAFVLWPYGVPAAIATLSVSVFGIWAAYRSRAYAVPITLTAALIASPLSWPTYALAALPVALLYARRQSPIPILMLAVPVALWSFLPASWIGHMHFLVLTILLLLIINPRAAGKTSPIPTSSVADSERP